MINGGEPVGTDGCRHPHAMGRTECPKLAAQSGQLGGCGQAVGHELHLVHHPQAVVVHQPVLDGPHVIAAPVAVIEGSGKQHVLGAHDDKGLFWLQIPLPSRLPAH